ncbi:MAG: complex I NDUFA9 subunit family protein [Desulfuromonadaceae bacterium]|nr:complex I NDUFA9 subunit family protein [Desulfuromonadaceae bacterium]
MKVFVSGGTGFVGREVVRQLLAAEHHPVCLVRPGSEDKLPGGAELTVRLGDVTDPASLNEALRGCQAVIHLVGIIRELPARGVAFDRLHRQSTAHMVAAAEAQGVERFIHMSANGVTEAAATGYYRSKWQAEQLLRGSALRWTIFRPSIIYGIEDDFCNRLAEMIRRLPVVPVVGDGRYRMAPVAVEDVAAGFVAALREPASEGQIYPVCGRDSLTFNEFLDHIGRALGRSRVCKVHSPLFLVKPLVFCLQNLPGFPLTSDQLTMLLAGNVCDPQSWIEEFGIEPQNFTEAISRQLQETSR